MVTIDWHTLLSDIGWESAGVHDTAEGPVAVASKVVAGTDCVRGELTTTVPVSALLRTVGDVDNSERWSSVSRSTLIGRAGTTVDWYQVLDVPDWTLAEDRYWLSRGGPEIIGASTVFHWTRVPDGEHEDTRAELRETMPGAIELAISVGVWTFTPTATGSSLRYAMCSKDDGSVPQSLLSYGTRRSLPDLLARLVRAARSGV